MIEPENISPFGLKSRTSSGKLFACYAGYAGIKYLLYDDGECIFEILNNPSPQGYYLCGKNYEEIKDLFVFLGEIRTKYPDVADWFLFNIKNFT
jgi:hypothetical protein